MQAPLLRQWAARLAPYLNDTPQLRTLHQQILEASKTAPETADDPPSPPAPVEPAPAPPPPSAPVFCEGAAVQLVVGKEGLISADPSDALVQHIFDLAVEGEINPLQGLVQVPVTLVLLNEEQESEYLSRKDRGQ